MLIDFDPDDYEAKSTHHTCDYHKRHPENRSYPGCTCGGSASMVKKPGPTKRERAMLKFPQLF